MRAPTTKWTLAAMLGWLAVAPAAAQTAPSQAESTQAAPSAQAASVPAGTDAALGSIQDGAKHLRSVFTQAAERMSEEDYAFRPTPEVRTLGQVLAHVAGNNYSFCSAVIGEKAPVTEVEKTRTTRDEIRQVLADSFAYCDAAYAAMADPARAAAPVELMGRPRPALGVLNFRNYHALLHWGNVITSMRLRGAVPPAR